MGFLDKFKGKATDLAQEHGDTIDQGIDKAADLADNATDGKYSDQIDSAAEKAKDATDTLGE